MRKFIIDVRNPADPMTTVGIELEASSEDVALAEARCQYREFYPDRCPADGVLAASVCRVFPKQPKNTCGRITTLENIWVALQGYRENCISGPEYDDEWDDICTDMAWIAEALGLEE